MCVWGGGGKRAGVRRILSNYAISAPSVSRDRCPLPAETCTLQFTFKLLGFSDNEEG